MFIKAHGLHLLTKPNKYIMLEDKDCDEYAVNNQL